MQTAIISYFAYRLTVDPITQKGDAKVLGLMGLAEVIPAIGFSLFSGHFVDISEKRSVVFRSILAYLTLSVFFAFLAMPIAKNYCSSSTIINLVYVGIFVGGALRAFISPATFALMGLLLPRRVYANASTWSSTSWQTGYVLGPLLGSLLMVKIGYAPSLTAVLVVQLVALIAVWAIPSQAVVKKEKEPIFKSLSEGIRFVFKNQIILSVLSLDMFAVLFGGANALIPVFADDILKIGGVGYGWLRASPGIGSIVMLFVLSTVPLKKKPGIKLFLAIVGFALSTIVFALCSNIASTDIWTSIGGCNISWAFVVAFLALFATGAFDAISVVIRGTILQLNTPDAMRGRVAAVNTMFISSSNELGAMESGFVASWMGTIPSVIFGGVMTLVIVAAAYIIWPVLRVLKLDGKQNV